MAQMSSWFFLAPAASWSVLSKEEYLTPVNKRGKMSSLTTDDVGAVLQEIFDDLGEDLDLGDVTLTAETRLLDLGLESISLVYLVSELQQHYGLGDRLFRRLRETGSMIRDLSVGEVQKLVVTLKQERAA